MINVIPRRAVLVDRPYLPEVYPHGCALQFGRLALSRFCQLCCGVSLTFQPTAVPLPCSELFGVLLTEPPLVRRPLRTCTFRVSFHLFVTAILRVLAVLFAACIFGQSAARNAAVVDSIAFRDVAMLTRLPCKVSAEPCRDRGLPLGLFFEVRHGQRSITRRNSRSMSSEVIWT